MSTFEEDAELEAILNNKLKKLMKSQRESPKYQGGMVHHLDPITLDEFLNNFKIALIDFWAEWCPPCHILSPIIEELATEYTEVGFGKVDVEKYPDVASYYGVINLPTLLLFYRGKAVDFIVGAVPKEYIEVKIRKLLS